VSAQAIRSLWPREMPAAPALRRRSRSSPGRRVQRRTRSDGTESARCGSPARIRPSGRAEPPRDRPVVALETGALPLTRRGPPARSRARRSARSPGGGRGPDPRLEGDAAWRGVGLQDAVVDQRHVEALRHLDLRGRLEEGELLCRLRAQRVTRRASRTSRPAFLVSPKRRTERGREAQWPGLAPVSRNSRGRELRLLLHEIDEALIPFVTP